MTAPLVFVDTETTGLNPDRHHIWEIGLIDGDGVEYQWMLPLTVEQMQTADPIALSIGRFHERHPQGNDYRYDERYAGKLTTPSEAIGEVLRITHKAHLVGAVVSFDEERLRLLALDHGMVPSWHYHLVCVEALAAGWIAATRQSVVKADGPVKDYPTAEPRPPWDSKALSAAVGVDCDQFDKHTALGDARWAKAIYEAVMGR